MRAKVLKLNSEAAIPAYAHDGDVCFDLVSIESLSVEPQETVVVGTGIALQGEPGYELQIRPRSGMAAKHGITVLNSPATIEPTYTGEIKVIIHNTSNQTYAIKKGDRIAQATFKRYETIGFEEVDSLASSERSDGGLGSSGR